MSSRISTLDAKRPPRARGGAPRARLISAKETSREASPANDANFQLLFSRNPYPMYVFDCETLRFLEVNLAATEQYGYSREEFLSMRITDIRPADDVPRLRQHLRKAGTSLSF